MGLIFGLCFVSMLVLGESLRGAGFDWVVIPLMLAAMGSLLYATWVVDCPKCHVVLGPAVWRVVSSNITIPYKFCPHCAVALDSELVEP
ncbi:hypothetical protein [Pseudoxanthomonas winnipegensis]|uniref:hypothetical protein n=1 Tax=Pseudoxanthomonas winnipegensis TaxID=2480810 RepID=UPI003F874285